MSSDQVQDWLLSEADIAVVSGSSFGIFGEGYIRISYAASMDELAEAMERIRKLFGGQG
jgi:aspartate/methionine/tyrosine aminotransferase